MKLEEQCTSVEQSKRLLELGFKRDTASVEWSRVMVTDNDESGRLILRKDWEIAFRKWSVEPIPCWTIADMMAIINSYREFSINILSQIEIYSPDEPCKYIIGKEVTVRDDYSILRDNLFEALVWIKKAENL